MKLTFKPKFYTMIKNWLDDCDEEYVLEKDSITVTTNVALFDIGCELENMADANDYRLTKEDIADIKSMASFMKAGGLPEPVLEPEPEPELKPESKPEPVNPCNCGVPYIKVAPGIVWCDGCREHLVI